MIADTLPPYRHISSTPLSLSAASDLLSTYLQNSESHPHLHPDALITPNGVTFGAHGGPTGGVIMHNLRRVAAGLRGEHLEPEPTPEPEDDGSKAADGFAGKKRKKNAEAEAQAQAEEGWQNMSEYEREEGVDEVGEIGDRTNLVEDGGEELALQNANGLLNKRKGADTGNVDKDARKKAKKARRKEEKREKEKKRQKDAQVDAGDG